MTPTGAPRRKSFFDCLRTYLKPFSKFPLAHVFFLMEVERVPVSLGATPLQANHHNIVDIRLSFSLWNERKTFMTVTIKEPRQLVSKFDPYFIRYVPCQRPAPLGTCRPPRPVFRLASGKTPVPISPGPGLGCSPWGKKAPVGSLALVEKVPNSCLKFLVYCLYP